MIKIDKELDGIEENVLKMGQKVVRMHEKVVRALNAPNKEIELDIVQSDDIIWRKKSMTRQYAPLRCYLR